VIFPGQTERRLRHATKAIARARQRAGLFADELITETPAERISRLDLDAAAYLQRQRDYDAAAWRRARRTLNGLPAEFGAAIRKRWNERKWLPGAPEYLLDLIRDEVKNTAAEVQP
jgi:hypothetical protein